jgi:N-acetylmuramoyl-L-alanine amidase
LAALHYAVAVNGSFGDDDVEAVYAFQKVEGLARTGTVDAALWSRLAHAHTPSARYAGDHVEVDKTRQVLLVVRGGQVELIVAVSTGATGNTPLGVWHVYRKVQGFDWVLYYPSYFLRGFAVHGYPDVPPYPASHGCVRIPMWVAATVYAQIAYGSAIYVYA